MEISWEHGYHRHYLLLGSEGRECSDYFLKVLKQNKVEGVLPVEKRETKDGCIYAYDTTGRESLKKTGRIAPMNQQELKKLLVQLSATVTLCEEYLLNSNNLLLEEDLMFLEGGRLMLCYYPEKQESFYESFRRFMEQLLKQMDHSDQAGTAFAYDLYDACRKDTFVLEEYLRHSWQSVSYKQEPKQPEDKSEYPVFVEERKKVYKTEKRRGLSLHLFSGSKRKKKEQFRREYQTPVWKLKGNQEFIVDKSPFLIGKQKEQVDGCVGSPHVSRLHAKLEQERGLFFLSDLNSTNGTYLNGRRLPEGKRELLSPGDRISFGDQTFLFVQEERY